MTTATRDRAAVVATAITQIVTSALRRWSAGDPHALGAVRAEVTDYLRDEIHDIERTMRDEIRHDGDEIRHDGE
jgi:hypothetical protein